MEQILWAGTRVLIGCIVQRFARVLFEMSVLCHVLSCIRLETKSCRISPRKSMVKYDGT